MFSHSTRKNNRGDVASNTTTDVQNGIYLHGHKPGDVSIRQSPHWQLSALIQTRTHSGTAAVVLSNGSKIIQSSLLLSFCCKFFYQSVS